MAEVVWTPQARDDLDAIRLFIARDSRRRAEAFEARVLMAVDQLESFPQSGRIVPEFKRADLRELIVENYRIIYRVRRERVEILTIVHGARRLRRLSRNGESNDAT